MENPPNFDLKYIIKDNIERVWSFFRDSELLQQSNEDFYVKYEFISGETNWSKNSKFILYVKNPIYTGILTPWTFTVWDCDSKPYHKYIIYNIQFKERMSLQKKVSLYQVSTDNSTVLIVELDNFQNIQPEWYKIMREINISSITREKLFMETSAQALFQYEAIIIDKPLSYIWSLLTNWKAMKSFSETEYSQLFKLNTIDFPEQPLKIGDEFTVLYEGKQSKLKVKSYDNDESQLRWAWEIVYLDDDVKFNEMIMTLVKINDTRCHYSWCHWFKKPETKEALSILSEKKRQSLKGWKDFIERVEYFK